MIAHQEDDTIKPIGIIDNSGIFLNSFAAKISKYKLRDNQPNYILRNLNDKYKNFNEIKKEADSLVLENDLSGYIAISSSNDSIKLEFRSKTSGNFKDIKRFESALNQVRIEDEFRRRGADTSLISIVTSNIEMKPYKVEKGGKETKSDFVSTFLSSLVFILILMMTIISSSGLLIRSIVEEKSNRLIEILVSSCSSGELLGGKVLGLSMLGLLQVFVWSIFGLLLASNNIILFSGLNNFVPMIIYFILGFVFYSSLFVGFGSIVSTEQEAQMINGYLMMFMLIPIIFIVPAIENPDSGFVRILSYIPFTTPTIMLLRLNVSQVSLSEIIITFCILIISTIGAIVFASKIFKIGILSYGKMPKIKEIIQWMKEK